MRFTSSAETCLNSEYVPNWQLRWRVDQFYNVYLALECINQSNWSLSDVAFQLNWFIEESTRVYSGLETFFQTFE